MHNLRTGLLLKTSQWANEGNKIIRIQNLTGTSTEYNYTPFSEELGRYIVKNGDLLISWSGTLGFYIWNGSDAYLNQHIFNVKTNSIILKKYLYFLGEIIVCDMRKLVHGGTMQHITKEYFEDIKIPLPPLSVQRQIVDELEGYQRIVDGAMVVVDSYKPSIPLSIVGEVKMLEDIALFRPSKQEIENMDKDTLVSFVPMADLNSHHISFSAKQTKAINKVYSGFTYFKNGDLLLAKITPCFENGKSGIARNLTNGIGFGSTEYIVMRADTNAVYPEWIYYHINSPEFLRLGKGFMSGTAGQQRVDINFVKEYSIVVPPLEHQRRVLDQIETEQKLIEPSKELVKVFTQKIHDRINELFD